MRFGRPPRFCGKLPGLRRPYHQPGASRIAVLYPPARCCGQCYRGGGTTNYSGVPPLPDDARHIRLMRST